RQMQQHFRTLGSLGKDAGPFFLTEDGARELQRCQAAVNEYEVSATEVLDQLRQASVGADSRAREILAEEARPKGDDAEALMSQLLDRKRANAQSFENEMDAVESQTIMVVAALTLAGVLIALVLGSLLSRMLSRQLGGEPDD